MFIYLLNFVFTFNFCLSPRPVLHRHSMRWADEEFKGLKDVWNIFRNVNYKPIKNQKKEFPSWGGLAILSQIPPWIYSTHQSCWPCLSSKQIPRCRLEQMIALSSFALWMVLELANKKAPNGLLFGFLSELERSGRFQWKMSFKWFD